MTKSLLTLLVLIPATHAFAHGVNTVVGAAECLSPSDEETAKKAATHNALEQCETPVNQTSAWKISNVDCYGPGHTQWKGIRAEATFDCHWHSDTESSPSEFI